MRLALVMHSPLGAAFNDCAKHILGSEPNLKFFDIQPNSDPVAEADKIHDWVLAADTSQPVIILSDLFGATPFNIATRAHALAQQDGYQVEIFTGANMCMLLKALTETSDSTEALIEKIYQGAQRGIVKIDKP